MKTITHIVSNVLKVTVFVFILTFFMYFPTYAENETRTAGSSLGKSVETFYKDRISTSSVQNGKWIKNSTGWWYEYSDGSWPSHSWRKIDGKWFYFDDNGYWIDNNKHEKNSFKGIDVSQWQGEIDWNLAKKDGIQFAFVRLGHGVHKLDTYYVQNMTGANKVGIPTGVYFYSTATTPNAAVLDARYVIDNLKSYKISYPIVIDLEDKVQEKLGKAQLGKIAKVYCDEIRKAGYTPMVYMNEYWYSTKVDQSYISNIEKWIARYNVTYNEAIPRSIWQACSTGKINGINTAVDINFGYKDYTQHIKPRTQPLSSYYKSRPPIGWVQNKTGWWYSNYDGSYLKNTWSCISGKWYYFNSKGYITTGWQKISGKWYYMNKNGGMTTGWQKVNNKWYYMNRSGEMQTGWIKVSGKWYYMSSSGSMKTGWKKLSGKWYYLNNSGEMQTGWRQINKKWYYMNRSGEMQTGWIKVSGKWYYLNTSGSIALGWKKLSGKWYYLNNSGAMLTGTHIIDGIKYSFNSSGAML